MAQIQQVKLTMPIVANLNQDSTCNLVLRLLFLADKTPNWLIGNGGAFIQTVGKKKTTKNQKVVITAFLIINFLRTGIQGNLQA